MDAMSFVKTPYALPDRAVIPPHVGDRMIQDPSLIAKLPRHDLVALRRYLNTFAPEQVAKAIEVANARYSSLSAKAAKGRKPRKGMSTEEFNKLQADKAKWVAK